MPTEMLVGSNLAMKEVQHARGKYQDPNVVQVDYLNTTKRIIMDQLPFFRRYIPMNISPHSIEIYD